jgi:hypothetical protein
MSGTVALTGPVETPGAPQLTPVTLSSAINTALATNYAAVTAETARAEAAEAALAVAQPWKLATVTSLGYGLGLYEGTLSVTFVGSEWQAGAVATLGAGLALADGVLSVIGGGGGGGDWGAGVVSTLGTGLALADGALRVDTDVIPAWADISVAMGEISDQAQEALTTATAIQTLATPSVQQTGIIIPFYQYVANPYDDANFSNLLTVIRSNPTVPCIVVVNQAGDDGLGGPGPYDAAMAQEIRMLQAAGATVAGYVSTVNGTRDPDLVTADILAWHSLYPLTLLDAVFFDQVPYDVGVGNANIATYIGYYLFAHQHNYKLVIGNPGSLQLQAWYDNQVADVYCCFEGDHWPVPADFSIVPPNYYSGAITDYPVRRYAGLIYSSSWDPDAYAALRPYLRWIYASDSPSPADSGNPWAALPTYLADLFAAAAQGAVIGTSIRTGGTGGPTWTAGSGAPSATQPNGSLYSRSDGTTGSRLYVSQGGGTWAGVSGV